MVREMAEVRWYTPSQDESFDRKVTRAVVTVIAAVFSIYLIYLLKTPLMWLTLSLFLAIAASGPVNALGRHMKRGAAIGIVYVLIILLPILLGALLLPPLVKSAVTLIDDLPGYINDLQNTIEKDPRFEKANENFDIQENLQKLQGDLANRIGDAAGVLSSIGEALINSIFGAFTIFVMSIFMVSRGRGWIDSWINTRAGPEAEALRRTVDRIGGSVGGYIGGALLQAFVAGLAAFIVLSILGIPSPLVLAVVVAAFDVVPMVGSTIAGVLVGIVTLFADFPVDTIIWAVFVIAYQQFENYVIQPRIQSRAVNMEPFIVLTAVLFGGTLMGVVGAIIAIPIAATLIIVFQEWRAFKHEVAGFGAVDVSHGPPDDESQSDGSEGSNDPSPAPA